MVGMNSKMATILNFVISIIFAVAIILSDYLGYGSVAGNWLVVVWFIPFVIFSYFGIRNWGSVNFSLG